MAVALEVGWGNGELGGLAHMSKKRAWGDDHQKFLELMMGKSFDDAGGSDEDSRHTLDLLGSGSGSGSGASTAVSDLASEQSSEFLELDQDVPLPSGWEKRLDLKSGTVYFINSNTGKTTYSDPRRAHPSVSACHMSLELLQSGLGKANSKGAEITTNSWEANLVTSSPSTNKQLNSNNNNNNNGSLDLKLNLSSVTNEDESELSTQGSPSCLCLLPAAPPPPSSPRKSSTTTTTTRTLVGSEENGSIGTAPAKVTLTGCKRCLMYVMISQADPRCPKCGSSVVLEFPMSKKRRLDLEL